LIALGAACLYFWWAGQPDHTWVTKRPAGFYPMLTDAFLHGRLYLETKPNPALANLADPYDPAQNQPYQINDLSYFRHRYYLYFGVTPVVTLLLPWTALTGTFLTEKFAVAFFTAASLGLSLLLLAAARRRHWPTAPGLLVLVAGIVLALGNQSLFLLRYPNYWQIAMACAWFWQITALGCGYRALHAARHPLLWLGLASAAGGLSVAARPSYLLGALLLAPFVWRLARQRVSPEGGWRRALPVVLAGGLPIAAIGVALMGYNYFRFGSPFEFGMRYQFIGVDLRHQPLLTPSAFWRNFTAYLFHVPRFVRYFPFLFDPPESTPVGALILLPFSWLAILLPFWWAAGPRSARGALGAFVVAAALAAGGNFFLLCFYFLVWGRHAFDLVLPLTWLAALGLMAGAQAVSGRPWPRRVFSLVAVALAIGNIGTSFFVGARAFHAPEKLAAVARLLNRPVYWFERLRGQTFGPLQLEVIFPTQRAGVAEPLLCTGTGQKDLLYVRYLDGTHVQLGLFHQGLGGPVSNPLEIAPGRTHRLEIGWGALCPPPQHPVFARWDQADILHARTQLDVRLDGRELFAQDAIFHPSTPGDLAVGQTPDAFGFCEAAFTGRITRKQQLCPVPPRPRLTPNRAGGCILEFSLARRRTGYSEPLIATGREDTSDLLFVQYLPDDRVRLGLDHWGGGAVFSQPIHLAGGSTPHRLAVFMPPLRSAASQDANPVSAGGSRLLLLCDDELLLDEPCAFHAAVPGGIYLGTNPFAASSAQPMFSGRILAVHSAEPELRSGREADLPDCPVSLLVRFPSDAAGRSEPLVVTGVTGAGDLLYVRYLDAHHLQFGFDHWGVGGIVGPPTELKFDNAHRIVITIGSLYSLPAAREAGAAASGRNRLVRVTLDGATALAGESPCHRAQPSQLYVGENPIGGSTCGERFTGRLLLVERGVESAP
jgi:hypothetical protein